MELWMIMNTLMAAVFIIIVFSSKIDNRKYNYIDYIIFK